MRSRIPDCMRLFMEGNVLRMIRLLARLFIANRGDTANPAVRRAYGVLCGAVGIALNAVLFAAKAFAGAVTGSIAMTADAFNNLSDALSSAITLVGFRLSGKRDDSEHPFGHGRAEYIAGLIVAMLILMMGFDLARSSVEGIFSPAPVAFSALSAGILAAAVLVKLYMAAYNAAVSRKIQSVAMRATAMDSLSDAAATLAVLASSLAGHFLNWNIDAYAGALVSVLILRAGYCAARDTISPLLGNPPDPEFVRRIEAIVNACPEIRGMHDLVVHDYGAGRRMISLHAEVPADGDIMAMHDAIDGVERQLAEELGCQAVIHMDPIATDDARVDAARMRVLAALRAALGDEVSVHDFRMVAGPKYTKLIFDVLVPNSLDRSDADVRRTARALVQAIDPAWDAVVDVDHPYV